MITEKKGYNWIFPFIMTNDFHLFWVSTKFFDL